MYFIGDDCNSGAELWKTDGSDEGTTQISDLYPGETGSDPDFLFRYENRVFMLATTPDTGRELWEFDLASENLSLLKDIVPGPESGFRAISSSNGYAEYFSIWSNNGFGYFAAYTPETDLELWVTDLTPEGTVLLGDINPTGTSFPFNFTVFDDYMVFNANDGTHGWEMWRYNFPSNP